MTQINNKEEVLSELTLEQIKNNWSALHGGDQEPWPENPDLQNLWLLFHQGQYLKAAEEAEPLFPENHDAIVVACKALSTWAHYLESDDNEAKSQLLRAAKLAETAIAELAKPSPHHKNLYYQYAFALGRYGQKISITQALADGLAGKIKQALDQTLALDSNHADAHTALATYQAEIIQKLGKFAAKLTYGAVPDDALSHYQQGIELAPESVSARTEMADGLLMVYGKKRLKDAVAIYQQAYEIEPLDKLTELDHGLAEEELKDGGYL